MGFAVQDLLVGGDGGAEGFDLHGAGFCIFCRDMLVDVAG